MWDSDGRETQNIKQIIILNQYQTLSLPQYEYQSEMGLGMFQGDPNLKRVGFLLLHTNTKI